ncbi:hybrid sensor histidine kinase/response regulator [Brevifollis gellanilyticus]|uniref:histidine kinase n=1 Tax=Brevifollis gellanilyticus TaxID=748831 RepID=A0A512M2Y4_9BACT|nr:ATP-binding protein [Brevifollis gellanilyticus]GEP41105.1 hypothetical protein BGE01nite_03960 [Brevifollis gellanilyticus]
MPRPRVHAPWKFLGVALFVVLASVVIRVLLHPWLGGRLPFLILLAGVAVAARFCRWQAALVASLTGFVVTALLYVSADSGIDHGRASLSMIFAGSVAVIIIILGERFHRWRDKLEAELEERREREHSLMEQARLLREAQHLSHIGSWDWDASTDVTRGSDELYRIYGLDPARDPMPAFKDQRGVFYPEEVWVRLNEAVQNAVKTGTGYQLEIEAFCAGKKIWVTARGEAVKGDHGRVIGLRGTVQDITEYKRAEEALHLSTQRTELVKDVAEVGYWFCDLPFDELEWDTVVKEHFWLPADARVNIDLFYSIMHPDDRERVRVSIEHSIAHKTRYDVEYRTVSPKRGEVKWIRAVGRTFYAEDGTAIRFDGATFDITASKKAEASLKESEAAARTASAAKDAFIAQLSHELRTPLTPVLMTAAELKDDPTLPPEVRQQLRMIERNISLEARLIDDLLDITRITRGKLSLRSEPCDVHSLLRHVAEMVRDEAREKRIEICLDLRASKACLAGDPTRLQQVFWNLLLNGIKFSPAGRRIQVRTSDNHDELCIEVEDEGIGLEPGMEASIFEPFEQGPISLEPRSPGLGLGLAIAKAVITLHGGCISASSAGPGKGARFTVVLSGVVQSAALSEAPPEDLGQPSSDGLIAMRLLVVEDHDPTLQVLCRLLKREGHSVVGVGTKADAVAQAGEAEFDAVLSDLGLPDGTGHELMDLLRERHGLRGIAFSGFGTELDMQNSLKAGFVAHLIKPAQFSEIRRALQLIHTGA